MAPPDRSLSALDDLLGESVGVHVDGVKVMALVKGVNGLAADAFEVVEIPYADKFARAASGDLYAVQCYVIDEPIGVAAETGARPAVMKLSDHGFVSTAQTVFASERVLADKPEAVRAFLSATFEGWRRALADKQAAAEVTVERFVPQGSVYKDVPYQVEVLRLLEPYVLGEGDMQSIGRIDPARWALAARQMADYGIVDALPDLDASLAPGFYG
jgi:ABC-type nitrate/sulfonate/bicarbonate transport system substrate-binding protein